MAARASMMALVLRVARLVNDPAYALWTEDNIQAALDANREEARYLPLAAIPTYAAGGAASYLTYLAGVGDWEEDVVLYNTQYTAITPATADYTAGRWTFAAEPLRPVLLLGWTYDVYAAAADLLEERAARTAEDMQSFTAPGGSVVYAGKSQAWRRMARDYRARQRVKMIRLHRSDEESG